LLLQIEGVVDTDDVRLGGRPFAVGDEVLALRNDYRSGILNGTTATITDIDHDRRLLHLTSDERAIVMPFGYAEGGDLTHAYATTLHKAQGATVDHAFVLVDETFAREHLYTALSRGADRNDLYVASIETHDADRHAPEPQGEVDVVTRVARRSAAQQLAVDHADDRLTPITDLEAERYRLVQRLSAAPDDPALELHDLQRRLGQRRDDRDRAVDRRDRAQTNLDELGTLGRRLHRTDRNRLERDRDRATDDVTRADIEIADLVDRANELTGSMKIRRAWQREHQPELDRLHEHNTTFVDRRLEATIARACAAGHEDAHDISL
jgi:hypothetical protein